MPKNLPKVVYQNTSSLNNDEEVLRENFPIN